MLQVYVAVSPTELPADVTAPLLGLLGLEHTAKEPQHKKESFIITEHARLKPLK